MSTNRDAMLERVAEALIHHQPYLATFCTCGWQLPLNGDEEGARASHQAHAIIEALPESVQAQAAVERVAALADSEKVFLLMQPGTRSERTVVRVADLRAALVEATTAPAQEASA